jgi:hypothetical protein
LQLGLVREILPDFGPIWIRGTHDKSKELVVLFLSPELVTETRVAVLALARESCRGNLVHRKISLAEGSALKYREGKRESLEN